MRESLLEKPWNLQFLLYLSHKGSIESEGLRWISTSSESGGSSSQAVSSIGGEFAIIGNDFLEKRTLA
jgi:hypothetical protein